MGMELLEKAICWFMVYSVGGWIYESILCSVTERRFVNRGFLNGPYCPIYGCGALFDLLLLGKVQNPLLLFLLGAVVTCTLEYLTSYAMEKLFHARWWDYSDRRFNIQGRVCLIGAVVFGTFSVVLIKVLQPAVVRLTDHLSGYSLPVVAFSFLTAFSLDIIVTLKGFAGFNERLSALADALAQKREEAEDVVRASALYLKLNSLHEEFLQKLNAQQRRMLSAFPQLHSAKYEPVLAEVKKYIAKRRQERRKISKA